MLARLAEERIAVIARLGGKRLVAAFARDQHHPAHPRPAFELAGKLAGQSRRCTLLKRDLDLAGDTRTGRTRVSSWFLSLMSRFSRR